MKKSLFVFICILSLLVCNIQTLFAEVGDNVVVNTYGSYQWDTQLITQEMLDNSNKFVVELNLGVFTLQKREKATVYTVEFNFYHYYTGNVKLTFGGYDVVETNIDWYIGGNNAVFADSLTENAVNINLNGCNYFSVSVVINGSNNPTFKPSAITFANMNNVDSSASEIGVLSSIDSKLGSMPSGVTFQSLLSDIKSYNLNMDNSLLNLSNLPTISTNISDIETILSNFNTNFSTYSGQVLTNLSSVATNVSSLVTKINTLVSSTSNIESDVDDLRRLVGEVVTNTTGTWNRLISLYNKVSTINDSVDGVETALADLKTSIEGLQNVRFQVQDLEMPFYQYLFFSVLTRSNMSLVHYDESNVPYVQWSEVKDLVMQINVTRSSNIEFCYYVNNSAVNRITVDGYFGSYDRGLGSATRYANYSKFTVTTGNHNVSFGRSDGSSNGVVPDSCRIYPIYMGYQGFVPREIALLFNLNTIDDSIYETLVDIYTTLSNIDTSSSNSALIQALEDLRTAISGFQNQVTINNTVSVNSHDLPIYQYVFLTMLTRNNVNLVHFDESGEPYVLWGEVKNNTFTFNPGTGTSNQILAYYTTDANLILTIDNESLTRNRGVGSSVRFSTYYVKELSFGNHTVTFKEANNTAISDNVRIYPIYMGRADCLPEIMGTVFGLETTANQYSLILNSLNALAANIDLNFGVYSAEMSAQIDALVVAMDSLLEFNLNIDSLFDKLFEINFDDLFGVDIDIDLKVLDDMLLNIGSILGGNIEDVVDYHDIWLQQYDLLDLDTKLTVPQEIQSGANALGNMFEQIVASDSTIGFITYSSLSIGLFGLYLGLRREKK